MSKIVEDKELEKVAGGTYDQINEIIDLFRKYGFNTEADKLKRSGSVLFEVAFRNVLKEMGFTHKLEVYADSDRLNWNFYQGKHIEHYDLMEILEEFLYKKVNNIVDM